MSKWQNRLAMAVMGRVLAGISGIFLLWCSVCLREDREKRIQARFETLWLELDAVRGRAIPIHTAILRTAATRTTRILDALFGPHVISVQAASVSLCLSIATIYVFKAISEPSIIALALALVLVGVSLAPVWRPRLRVLPTVMVPLIIVLAAVSAVMTDPLLLSRPDLAEGWTAELAAAWAPLVAAVCCDFLIIAVSRVTLRAVSRRLSPAVVIVASIAGLLIPIATVLLLAVLAPDIGIAIANAVTPTPSLQAFLAGQQLSRQIADGVFGVALSNIYSSIGIAIFFFLAAFLAIHLLVWEAIQGPLYAAQRFGIASRHTTLALLGCSLLSFAFAPGKIAWLIDAVKAF